MKYFAITGFAHATVLVENLNVSLRFYCDVLGMERLNSRPEMEFEGAWLAVGAQEVHLMVLPSPDPTLDRPLHPGRDRHMAFHVHCLESICRKFELEKIPYTRSKSGRAAVFFRDPDANGIELIEKAD